MKSSPASWDSRSRAAAPLGRILPRRFYARPTVEVARDLLGAYLVHRDRVGRIVEAEAYLGLDDLAAHASRGLTDRTRVLFGPPGHAYVYLVYGMYECLNLVAEPDGTPGCVLIRALEPVCGLHASASGPGRLTRAMGISRRDDGRDVTRGPLVVRAPLDPEAFSVAVTPRVGITRCADWPLRFYIEGNPFVSRAAPRRTPSSRG